MFWNCEAKLANYAILIIQDSFGDFSGVNDEPSVLIEQDDRLIRFIVPGVKQEIHFPIAVHVARDQCVDPLVSPVRTIVIAKK